MIARGFDDRVAGQHGGAAAGLADRIRAAGGIAPDHFDLRERHVERFGGDQSHGGFGAAADVGDADVNDVAAL